MGGALLYPFFALYFTSQFGVGLIVESGQPARQAMVARFAPEDMRGRYMAIYGVSFSLPFAFGPLWPDW